MKYIGFEEVKKDGKTYYKNREFGLCSEEEVKKINAGIAEEVSKLKLCPFCNVWKSDINHKGICKECRNKPTKAYAKDHKDRLTERFNCPCGGTYQRRNKSIHFKSKRHIEYENENDPYD